MYAVIYWIGIDNEDIYPFQTIDKRLKVFDYLEEADNFAKGLEKRDKDTGKDTGIEARVISIEGVKE